MLRLELGLPLVLPLLALLRLEASQPLSHLVPLPLRLLLLLPKCVERMRDVYAQ